MVSADRWPFVEPRNCVTFVSAQVLEGREPILHAVHDEHGEWQFLGSTDGTLENAKIIALHEAAELDASVLQLANLPVGWRAVRDSPDQPWRREAMDRGEQTI
jgi:hypothetical protein